MARFVLSTDQLLAISLEFNDHFKSIPKPIFA
jgi:hypothetical protein